MIDPLENFDFASIYRQYNNFTRGYGNFRDELEKMELPPEITDLELYYHLKEEFGRNRININIYDYIALLFWKLNFLPINRVWRVLLNNQELREAETDNLNYTLNLNSLPPYYSLLNRDIYTVADTLNRADFGVYGMRINTDWPTRSVLLHFLYPHTIPIFDQMVLRAVEPNYQANYATKKDKFLEYIEFVWKLTEKYAEKIQQIENLRDTDIRIIEMALWIVGH